MDSTHRLTDGLGSLTTFCLLCSAPPLPLICSTTKAVPLICSALLTQDRDLSLVNEAYVRTYQKTLLYAQKTLLYAAGSESSGDYKKLLTAYIGQIVK